ncbi:G-alpha-domain-containing protein [Pluteus cervinus]|uniref:G-alpha-domain-containing protein n=1 Tax=Pluteus cervinus TaxID=181527 RepID=A0ACD3B599_9AGAR|nr:G-alpha-domain-containing protein [Pluteus cervinus]
MSVPSNSRSMRNNISDDPFDELLRPPPDERPEDKAIRLAREEEAKKVSMAIDASIKAEKQARRKKRIVRLLLLGQSESGKSTTLRQFQRLYTPTAFREERILWRAVIQLNIVRSIRTILDALTFPIVQTPQTSPMSSPRSRARSMSRGPPAHLASTSTDWSNGNASQPGSPRDLYDNHHDITYTYTSSPPPLPHQQLKQQSPHRRAPSETSSDNDMNSSNPSSTTLATTPLDALKLRLSPLRHIEQLLIAKLVPPNEDEATQLAGPSHSQYPSPIVTAGAGPSSSSAIQPSFMGSNGMPSNYRNQEIFIRPGNGWKGALARARVNYPSYSLRPGGGSGSGSSSDAYEGNGYHGHVRPNSAGNLGLETPDEPQEVLYQCRKDMIQLWNDEFVRDVLRRKKIRLEEFPGFFLNDLDRVSSLKYMPTDDDVLKARLKTVGVSEYKFEMEVPAGRDAGTEWRIVDVGGSRNQRQSWAPFFDDVDAIIFLAPISGFDQVLAEDRTVNRLEDSVLLWKAVCSNRLLANVDLVLFLNKCDILDAKLKSGIQLTKYVRSYGDRENDLDTVSKYLRGKFSAIHREYSPNPRKFYSFCTSVTDTATTSGIIASVRDMVIRQHLKQSKLL